MLQSLIACTILACLSTPDADVRVDSLEEGALAVRSSPADWTFPAEGDVIRLPAEVRSSAVGTCRLVFGKGSLQLAPDSNVAINGDGIGHPYPSGVDLFSGSCSIRALARTVVRHRLSEVVLDAGSSALFVTHADGLIFRLDSGEASIGGTRMKPGAAILVQKDKTSESPEFVDLFKHRPQGVGQLLVRDPQEDSSVRLNLVRYHVNVVLMPPVALVQIDQAFYNPYSRMEEGTFVFNLPAGASVSRFGMYTTPEQLIEGELIERKRASRIYESIVRRRRDPAILEQIGDNLFRMRVFPVFAKDTKRVLLDYTVPLDAVDGKYSFKLPLVTDLKPIHDFRITGSIRPPLTAKSVTTNQPIELKPEADGRVTFDWKQRSYQPTSDLQVQFEQPIVEEPIVRSWKSDEENSDDWHHVITLPQSPANKQPRDKRPADVLILADTSDRSRGHRGEIKRAVADVLNNLGPDDRFYLGAADVDWRQLVGWSEANAETRAATLQTLADEVIMGKSYLEVSTLGALKAFAERPADRRRVAIYIGAGADDKHAGEAALMQQVGGSGVQFSSVLLKSWADAKPLLGRLAQKTGGMLFERPQKDSSAASGWFRFTLQRFPASQVITAATIKSAEPKNVFIRNSSRGGTSHLFAKTEGSEPLELAVTTGSGQDTVTKSWTLPQTNSEDIFAARLWAQRRLEELAAILKRNRTTSSEYRTAETGMVRLSQEWSLLSPLTAFLVLETEADYQRWNIDRKRRHRYWKPAEKLQAIPIPAELKALAAQSQLPVRPRIVPSDLTEIDGLLKRGSVSEAEAKLQRGNWKQLSSAEAKQLGIIRSKITNAREQEGFLPTHESLAGWFNRTQYKPAELFLPQTRGARYPKTSPEFERLFPRAARMQRKVSSSILPMDGNQFRVWLQQVTGEPVLVDQLSLDELAVEPEELEFELAVTRPMTLRNAIRHMFDTADGTDEPLALMETEDALVITTRPEADAEENFSVRFLPVSDLVGKRSGPGLGALVNPFLDIEDEFQQRVQKKLAKPMVVDGETRSITDWAQVFAEHLGENVVIDKLVLEELGLEPNDSLKSLHSGDQVPLRWALEFEGVDEPLTLLPDREALLLTTQAEADGEERFSMQIYPVGLLLSEFSDDQAMGKLLGQEDRFGGGWGGGGGGFGGGGLGGLGGFGGGGGGLGGGGGSLGSTNLAQISPKEFSISESAQPENQANEEPAPQPSDVQPQLDAQPESSQPEAPGVLDFQNMMDLLRSATSPQAEWQETDGAGGTVGFFAPSLSLLVRQRRDTHNEIAKLLKVMGQQPRLDDFPVPKPRPSDYQSLMDLVRRQTSPPAEWQYFDGAGGTITVHPATGSLIVRQNSMVHEETYDLLTRLRRSMANQQFNQGVWSVQQFPRSEWIGTDVAQEELKALSVRKTQPSGHWMHTTGGSTQALAFKRNGDGLTAKAGQYEITINGHSVRTLWPKLLLAETSADPSVAKQALDLVLPWLPHRTNRELAEMFDVSVVSDGDKTQTLKLQLAGGTDNYATAEYSKESGQMQAWTMHVNGKRTYRLRFAGEPNQQQVTVVFPELNNETWKPQPADARFTTFDKSYVTHSVATGNDKPTDRFSRLLTAIHSADFTNAVAMGNDILASHPDHALTLFYKAQCREYSKPSLSRAAALSCLQTAAKNEVVVRWIDRSQFQFLSAIETYELSLNLPESARTDFDLYRLATLALEAHSPAAALSHLQKIRGGHANHRFFKLQLRALLDGGQADKATALVNQIAASNLAPSSMLEVASFLRSLDQPESTEVVLSGLLNRYKGSQVPIDILRRCAYRSGYPQRSDRLFMLLDRLGPEDKTATATARGELIRCLTEYRHTVRAMVMAEQTRDDRLRVDLVARCVDLGIGTDTAARVLLPLLENGDVTEQQLDWLSGQICQDKASLPQYIDSVETRIRTGKPVSARMYAKLKTAYQAQNQPIKAVRALSQTELEDKRETARRRSRSRRRGFGTGLF